MEAVRPTLIWVQGALLQVRFFVVTVNSDLSPSTGSWVTDIYFCDAAPGGHFRPRARRDCEV